MAGRRRLRLRASISAPPPPLAVCACVPRFPCSPSAPARARLGPRPLLLLRVPLFPRHEGWGLACGLQVKLGGQHLR